MMFKAIIRVCKSLVDNVYGFGSVDVLREPFIEVSSKDEALRFMLEKYPQFFQNGKIYQKETKDQAQFFYCIVYPLYNYEVDQILEGEWKCDECDQVHENKYVEKPERNERLFADKIFCRSEEHICFENYKKRFFSAIEMPDNELYIKRDSPIYIYKITEKSSGKSYIGKTRNAPFFRWWEHLTRSSSPFGLYLKGTMLTDWTFEVIDQYPAETEQSTIFNIESKYILQYNCLENGFNSLISKKQPEIVIKNQIKLF